MATSRKSGHVFFKSGKCQNENCSKYKSGEIQKKSTHQDFVCTECGKPLHEIKYNTSHLKLIVSIAAIVVIGIAIGAYFLFKSTPEPENITISLNHNEVTLNVGELDTLKVEITPPDINGEYEWASSDTNILMVSDGIVTAKGKGNAKAIVKLISKDSIFADCAYVVEEKIDTLDIATKEDVLNEDSISLAPTDKEVATQNNSQKVNNFPSSDVSSVVKTTSTQSSGRVNLGFGTYQGDMVGGKPHGQGKLVYTTHTIISKYDPKKRTAEAGEYIQGQFVNGNPTIVKHYDENGHLIETLNLGVD